MNTFFTADTHFHHANIIRYCKRPQLVAGDEVTYTDDEGRLCTKWVSPEVARIRCKAMDDMLKANWNETVTPDDVVWHLGDVLFGSVVQAIDTLCELNFSKLYFIWGNHDSAMEELERAIKANRVPPRIRNRVVFCGNMREIRVEGQKITVCHYPMFRWNRSHHLSWMLHGHCHCTISETRKEGNPTTMGLILDVGVDGNDFRPYSFEEIKIIMAQKSHYMEERFSQLHSDKCKPIHESI